MPTPANAKPANPTLSAHIRKNFPAADREFSLDVEFSAAPGFTILFGASGSGKTTLLDCVAGLASPDAGRIAVGERALFDANARTHVPVASAAWDMFCRILHCFRISRSSKIQSMDSRICRARSANGGPRRCCRSSASTT